VVHACLQARKGFVDKPQARGNAFEENANALGAKAEEALNSASSLQDPSNALAQIQEPFMDASETAQLKNTKALDDMGNTIDNTQRPLDSLAKNANKNKGSFFGPNPDEHAKRLFDRPHTGHASDRHSDRKDAMDDKFVRHNNEPKKATERGQ
jgi:hypothetical protein